MNKRQLVADLVAAQVIDSLRILASSDMTDSEIVAKIQEIRKNNFLISEAISRKVSK